MKFLFATAAMSIAMMGAATAADLPARVAPPVFVPPALPFSWTGPYAGINAGYAFSSRDSVTTTAGGGTALGLAIAQGQVTTGTVPTSEHLGQTGFAGGGQIGYNYQFGANPTGGIVLGVEADIDYTDLHRTDPLPTAFGTQNTYSARLSYLGTARGRLGYAFDRVLVYGTGGFAYGETNYAHTYLSNQTPPQPIFAGARSGMQTGYAIGGGVEYALSPDAFNPFGGAVTLRAEYLYYDLGARTTAAAFVVPAIPSFLNDRYRTAGNIVRFGLNFKFGSPAPAPVVARY